MNTKLIAGTALIVAAAAVAFGPKLVDASQGDGLNVPPSLPANPAVELPVQLIHAQPFELAQPATHYWRAEQPNYTTGLLLVLEADATYLAPRQTAEPVLYVGNQTFERIGTGYPSGQIVGIVPGMTLADLADAPIFFGQATLPESVDAAYIQAEYDSAVASGLKGVGVQRVAMASASATEPIQAADLADLYYDASFLIEKYSPAEKDLIEGLRVERVVLK